MIPKSHAAAKVMKQFPGLGYEDLKKEAFSQFGVRISNSDISNGKLVLIKEQQPPNTPVKKNKVIELMNLIQEVGVSKVETVISLMK